VAQDNLRRAWRELRRITDHGKRSQCAFHNRWLLKWAVVGADGLRPRRSMRLELSQATLGRELER
jgi:hypothetical protein